LEHSTKLRLEQIEGQSSSTAPWTAKQEFLAVQTKRAPKHDKTRAAVKRKKRKGDHSEARLDLTIATNQCTRENANRAEDLDVWG